MTTTVYISTFLQTRTIMNHAGGDLRPEMKVSMTNVKIQRSTKSKSNYITVPQEQISEKALNRRSVLLTLPLWFVVRTIGVPHADCTPTLVRSARRSSYDVLYVKPLSTYRSVENWRTRWRHTVGPSCRYCSTITEP